MGAAFTPEEQAMIKADLLSAGKKFLNKYGRDVYKRAF